MPELGEVVGANVRRLRGQMSMRAVVDAAKARGSRWSTGSLDALEHGRRRVTVEDLVIAASALSDVTGQPVTVSDLLETTQPIELGDGTLEVSSTGLLEFLGGSEPGEAFAPTMNETPRRRRLDELEAKGVTYGLRKDAPPGLSLADQMEAIWALTEADKRIARNIESEMSINTFAMWSAYLWGSTFTAERDARAGDGASAQKRGRITREMKAELTAAYAAHAAGKPQQDYQHFRSVLHKLDEIEETIRRGND